MSNDLFEDAETGATPKEPIIEPEPRIRTQLLDSLNKFAAELGGAIDAPTLADLLAQPDAQIYATRGRVLDAISLSLRGFLHPAVPTIEVQMKNFAAWQGQRGAGYFEWPPDAMQRLRDRLAEYGEGIELRPCFAHSVAVRLTSGLIVFINRAGVVSAKAP